MQNADFWDLTLFSVSREGSWELRYLKLSVLSFLFYLFTMGIFQRMLIIQNIDIEMKIPIRIFVICDPGSQ